MAMSGLQFESDEIHPIDIAETIAAHHDWDFDRMDEDQIAVLIEGQWRNYSVTLAWSHYEETLRSICTFEMSPKADRIPALYEMLNKINDMSWSGAFSFWPDQNLMVFKYGFLIDADQVISSGQVDRIISTAVASCERFYPAFQLVTWAERSADEAIDIAITEAYGTA